MAFVGTHRPTDTNIQMPLAAYQHLMAEAPLFFSREKVEPVAEGRLVLEPAR